MRVAHVLVAASLVVVLVLIGVWIMLQVTPESEFKPGQDGKVSCARR